MSRRAPTLSTIRRVLAAAPAPRRDGPLGPLEAALASRCEDLFVASTTPMGWPRVEHRRGPGLVRVLDGSTLVIAAGRGVSTGEVVTLLLVDAGHHRLQLSGRLERSRAQVRVHVEAVAWPADPVRAEPVDLR